MTKSDIVERLEWFHEHGMCSDFKLIWDARDEIDQLRGMVARDTGTWQDLFHGERAANERITAELKTLQNSWVEINDANKKFMDEIKRLTQIVRDQAAAIAYNQEVYLEEIKKLKDAPPD